MCCLDSSQITKYRLFALYSKTCVKRPLSNYRKLFFKTSYRLGPNNTGSELSLNAGQKYCRMLPLVAFCKRLTFIKLPFVIKIFVCLFLVAVIHRFYCKITAKSSNIHFTRRVNLRQAVDRSK